MSESAMSRHSPERSDARGCPEPWEGAGGPLGLAVREGRPSLQAGNYGLHSAGSEAFGRALLSYRVELRPSMAVNHVPADFCPHMAGHLFRSAPSGALLFWECPVSALTRTVPPRVRAHYTG